MTPSQLTDQTRSSPSLSEETHSPERKGVEDSSELEVELSNTQNRLEVDHPRLISLVRDVLAIEGISRASISVVLVDNPTIHEINRNQLGHDWPTDVITFPLSSPEDEVLSGELVVSAEMASQKALEYGCDPWLELALYVVHGVLHLCGYDDQDEVRVNSMRRREGEVLALLWLENPFPLGMVDEHSSANGPE